MGIFLSIYFLWSVYVYLSVYEYLDLDRTKIYLPLLVIIGVFSTAPLILLISFLDFSRGKVVRQVVSLSVKFIILKLL